MPWVIDYPLVLDQMRAQGLVCLYYNSGAFGFPRGVEQHVVGWIGGEDATIRPEARVSAVVVPSPVEPTLARLFVSAWQKHLPGSVWLMPKTHWSHELHHGHREWLPAVLEQIGIDPGQLDHRTNAAAIEFGPGESQSLEGAMITMLSMLNNSDFQLAFPRRPVLCTLHSHKQLWWQTTDPQLVESLRQARM